MMARTTTRPERPGAEDLVLASKFSAPRLPAWMVARPRLDARIAQGAAGLLTVVTGPPGAGKTTALASWAAGGKPGRTAWVTVDDYDNQPGIFWSSVVRALRRAGTGVPRTMPVLPREEASRPAFLPRLASALAALEPPVVLVLDDLHLLTASGPLEELAYLLKYARPGLRLVAAARVDPRLPLHRHRLAGELAEIRAGDLAFTIPEAARLMAQHGLKLPPGTVKLIADRVEGWAAGLRLAALSLDGHPDPEVFIKNLAAGDNALTSYLVDEVLDAQPPAGRELMLRTSILDRVSAELALELTGDELAGSTLAALARSGALIQPLGHGWYRYHSMFAEVLRLKLRREFPDLTPGLHRKAASWYQRNGQLGKAVAHAAQVSDWQLAARITVDELATGELLKPRASSPVAASCGGCALQGWCRMPRRSRTPCWRPRRWTWVMAMTRPPAPCSLPRKHSSTGSLLTGTYRPGSQLRCSVSPYPAGRGILAQPAPLTPRQRPCSGSFRPACDRAARGSTRTYCLAGAWLSSGPAISPRRSPLTLLRRPLYRQAAGSGQASTATLP